MRGEGLAGAVSIPFALGIATGGFLISHFSLQQGLIAAAAAMPFCAAAVVSIPFCRGNSSIPATSSAFLFLGLFCSLSYWLRSGGTGETFIASTAGNCLQRLNSIISGIPFQKDVTAALVRALLTGDRSGLPSEVTAAFRDSGASHILALSGLHLGVIYLIVNRFLSIFGNGPTAERTRSVLLVSLAGFYTAMTGAGPSIVRAFLFIVLNEAGKLSPERERRPVCTLLAALTVQLALNPSVISSLGFQLSYLAMTGIVTVFPHMAGWFPDDGRSLVMRKIWESTALTVSCQLFTAPLVWIRFGTFPKYFLLTNLLALPLTSAVMFFSVAVICLSGMGVCPGVMVKVTEGLVQVLVSVLDCISGM